MNGFEQVARLFFAECFFVENAFQSVHRGGDGRLKFVRGHSEEIFLPFKQFLAAHHALLDGFVQLRKFLDARRVVKGLVFLSYLEIFHPFQQSSQRAHGAMDGENIDGKNAQQ